MEKKLRSEYVVRFSDCDPFGHLNNARYIDYFLNAREDHLKKYYDIDLQTYYRQGLSWFVGSHEILYVRPALYNEKIVIHSSIIQSAVDSLWVELLMTDERETHIKSIMWTKFVPVSVKTGKKENHPEAFMDFARQVTAEGVDLKAGLKGRITTLQAEMKSQPVQA